MKRNTKGITLIGLVVTIVILLILVGVSIATLTESGLFEKARQAEQKSQNSQVKEEITLADYENKIGGYVEGIRDKELEINKLKARIEELENLTNYSTTEKVVGKWIDGKTIYQITYSLTSSSVANENYSIQNVSALNIDSLIDIKAISEWTNGVATNHQNLDAGDNFNVWYNSSTNTLEAMHIGSHFSNQPVKITIQYTKK